MASRSSTSLGSRLRPAERPNPFALLATLVTVGVFFILGGPVGVASGLLVVLAAVLGGPLVGFVVGHAALAVVLTEPSAVTIIVAEAGLGMLLVAASVDGSDRVSTGLLTALAFVGTAAFLVVVSELVDPLWGVTAVVVGTLVLVGYTLHRYELVTLGLVTDGDGEASE